MVQETRKNRVDFMYRVEQGYTKARIMFKAGYRGGRIFGGVPSFLASFYRGIKYFGKNYKISDGL